MDLKTIGRRAFVSALFGAPVVAPVVAAVASKEVTKKLPQPVVKYDPLRTRTFNFVLFDYSYDVEWTNTHWAKEEMLIFKAHSNGAFPGDRVLISLNGNKSPAFYQIVEMSSSLDSDQYWYRAVRARWLTLTERNQLS